MGFMRNLYILRKIIRSSYTDLLERHTDHFTRGARLRSVLDSKGTLPLNQCRRTVPYASVPPSLHHYTTGACVHIALELCRRDFEKLPFRFFSYMPHSTL